MPIREANYLPQVGEICSGLCEDCCHVVAPVLLKIKESQRPRLPQHIREFLRLESWIDRDKDHTSEARAQLQQFPFGNVRCPDGDSLAGLEPGEQGGSDTLGFSKQLRIGPPSTR